MFVVSFLFYMVLLCFLEGEKAAQQILDADPGALPPPPPPSPPLPSPPHSAHDFATISDDFYIFVRSFLNTCLGCFVFWFSIDFGTLNVFEMVLLTLVRLTVA